MPSPRTLTAALSSSQPLFWTWLHSRRMLCPKDVKSKSLSSSTGFEEAIAIAIYYKWVTRELLQRLKILTSPPLSVLNVNSWAGGLGQGELNTLKSWPLRRSIQTPMTRTQSLTGCWTCWKAKQSRISSSGAVTPRWDSPYYLCASFGPVLTAFPLFLCALELCRWCGIPKAITSMHN